MKKTLSILAASMLLAFSAHADEAHHPDKKGDSIEVKAPAQAIIEGTRKLQYNVKKMQAQLDLLAKSKAPEEQQKALAENMQTMHESMMLGKSMAGGGMKCPMMEGGMDMMNKKGMGMMGPAGEGAGPEAMMGRMQQMEKRMDMMQMMMEQMNKPQSLPAK
ncbi:MAG: hypothetical protein D4S02_16310 [Rhodocyclaceae bacterium]|nr:MAG: hypothetical protein D4S02_16310 [Rhodocyclaceae bacterium]